MPRARGRRRRPRGGHGVADVEDGVAHHAVREAEQRLLEVVVEAVHEHEHLAAAGLLDRTRKRRLESLLVDDIRRGGDEVAAWIGGLE